MSIDFERAETQNYGLALKGHTRSPNAASMCQIDVQLSAVFGYNNLGCF